MQLFIDLDGVLADFDSYYMKCFGVSLAHRNTTDMVGDPPGMWDNIRSHGAFYREMPTMPDAYQLWNGVKQLNPIVLTGVPYYQVPEAEGHKRAWMRQHFGAEVPVLCCRSQDKAKHGKPGDVLVDDWIKYRHLWEEMGGVFLLHTSAQETLDQLVGMV